MQAYFEVAYILLHCSSGCLLCYRPNRPSERPVPKGRSPRLVGPRAAVGFMGRDSYHGSRRV